MISTPLPTQTESPAFVQYVSPDRLYAGAALEEQAALFDSAPLFVPGPWNAAHNLEVPSRDRTLLRFPAYEPLIDFSSELLPTELALGHQYAVKEPLDLLALRFWDVFRGFAHAVRSPLVLETTATFAEVRSMDGRVIRKVPADIELLSMEAVRPVSYYVRVEAGGRPLGRPTFSDSSGDAAFDTAAYAWLVNSNFLVGLPTGLFEISIYP